MLSRNKGVKQTRRPKPEAPQEPTPGPYTVVDFNGASWGDKHDGDAVFKIYEKIADYANENNLDIVKIGKMEESHFGARQVAVIFKTKD